MTVIDENTVIFNSVYMNRPEISDEPIFAYIRFLKDGEIGFSVLDEAVSRPDYSNCGVFWVRPEDFLKVFRPLRPEDLDRYESFAMSGREGGGYLS